MLATLCEVAGRYGIGEDRHAPRAEAIAAVHEVTTNPWLLGIGAGVAMADPTGISGPTLRLLEAAGADMRVAAGHAVEVRGLVHRWVKAHALPPYDQGLRLLCHDRGRIGPINSACADPPNEGDPASPAERGEVPFDGLLVRRHSSPEKQFQMAWWSWSKRSPWRPTGSE